MAHSRPDPGHHTPAAYDCSMTGNGAEEIGRLARVRMRLTGETFEEACAALEGRTADEPGEAGGRPDIPAGDADASAESPDTRTGAQRTARHLRIVEQPPHGGPARQDFPQAPY